MIVWICNLKVHKPHNKQAKDKGFLGNLVLAFAGKKYTNESLIISTIFSVVRKFCEQGNIIVVGRAGCTIAKDIKKALHIRIFAPFEYRVNVIQKRFQITNEQAIEKIQQTDLDRKRFMLFFKEKRNEKEIFDVFFNRSKMTQN